jgi:uncharacterized protein YjbI with pentapeptide repeats
MRKIYFVLMVLVGISFLIYKYFEDFACWLYPINDNRNAELFKILLTVIGGLGVLYSLYLNFRKSKSMEKGILLQGKAIDKQSDQLELSRKSQIDERFKNAIEHLGSEKEPIILGGIAELNQIARENPNNYAEVVFNIMTSFIRSSTDVYKKNADDFSPTIIQTIINYLFKSKDDEDNPYNGLKGNLSNCNLLSIDIDNVNFSGFDLSFSLFPMTINDVDFSEANLAKSQFGISRIKSTNFSGANLHDSLFHLAEIKDSNFENASVLATNFLSTIFKDVNFDNCDFSSTKFICCFFNNTSHLNSNIINNDFSFSNFNNVDLVFTNLFGRNNFTGNYFYNFKINRESMELNFKGCDILDVSDDYCQLIDELDERVGNSSNSTQIVNLNECILNNQFTFGLLTSEDVLNVKKKYESILEEFEKLASRAKTKSK